MYRLFAALLFACLATTAHAESPNYNYIEAGYQLGYTNHGFGADDNVSSNGYVISGSFEFAENFFAFGGYKSSSSNFSLEPLIFAPLVDGDPLIDFDIEPPTLNIDVDSTTWNVGIGYRYGLTENTDFLVAASYAEAKFEASITAAGIGWEAEAGFEPEVDFGPSDGTLSIVNEGFGLEIGIRSNVTDVTELFGSISVSAGGDASNTGINTGVRFNLMDNFALGLSAGFSDGSTSYGLAARLYFGG